MKDSARRRARHITIFLDVDGVLNSFPVEGKRFKKEGRKEVHAWNYVLHFRPKIIKALEKIVKTRDADIVWLSTWSALCRTEIEPKLKFERSYPIIEMPDATYNRHAGDHTKWWKSLAMKQWLADNPGKRAVWVDDDLAHENTREYFEKTYRNRMLLIAPEFKYGLTEEQVTSIEDFSYPRPSGSEPMNTSDFVVAPAHDADSDTDAERESDTAQPTFSPEHTPHAGPDPETSASTPQAGPDPETSASTPQAGADPDTPTAQSANE